MPSEWPYSALAAFDPKCSGAQCSGVRCRSLGELKRSRAGPTSPPEPRRNITGRPLARFPVSHGQSDPRASHGVFSRASQAEIALTASKGVERKRDACWARSAGELTWGRMAARGAAGALMAYGFLVVVAPQYLPTFYTGPSMDMPMDMETSKSN